MTTPRTLPGGRRRRRSRPARRLGVSTGGVGLDRGEQPGRHRAGAWLQTPHAVAPSILSPRLFAGWEKPDLVLVVSGEQHGYLLPCGCSHPQKGGLERRYNLIEALRNAVGPCPPSISATCRKLWPCRIAQHSGAIKYRYAMKAMKAMDYTAVGIGEYEASMPLAKALDEYALNNEKPPWFPPT